MGVKFKTIKNDFPSMQRTLKSLSGRKVNVGCLQGSHAWLAAIHEYGCRINVTPKMRAYLHSIGIHLKSTTTVITIPERSFLRAGFDTNIDKIMKQVEPLLSDVTKGTMSEDEFLKLVGILLSSEIKEYALNLKDPPNSRATQAQKGSNNPLFDTGQMIGGITFEVE